MIKFLNPYGKYLVCDTETESLNLINFNKPYEFSYHLIDKGEIVERNQRFLWWEDLKMSEDAARITRFDYEAYKSKAEDPKKIFDEVREYFYGHSCPQVWFNGLNFDIYMVKIWLSRIGEWKGFNPWIDNLIDVHALYKGFIMDDKPDFNNFTVWQFKWINTFLKGKKSNLAAASKALGVEVDTEKTHEGDYDAYLTAKCLQQLAFKFQDV